MSYQITNTYSAANVLNFKTKNVWFVCHGMGYLSRYFLKYFSDLNPEENYLIAPQAQSKYYIPPAFKHVGASWLTKENTKAETENVMRNFDAIFENEQLPDHINLIVVGYSQGVSVAMRYVASRKIKCSQLVLMSGGIPKELEPQDFDFLNTKVTMIYGKDDEYLDDERIKKESRRIRDLFGDQVDIIPFEGPHMVNTDLIQSLL
ncbi:MAG: esterase [Flavobacteriaceae bacterium]|nr:MAG: esterase [Flavobacteriaceae bacterium]